METNNIVLKVVKQLLAYSIDSTIINDNTVTHFHSDEFLDNHVDRRKTPEYTEKEKLELMKYINGIRKII